MIYNICNNSTASATLHKETEKYSIERAVRQGDNMSHKQFTAILEYAFRALDWEQNDFTINGVRLNNNGFANDIVLIRHKINDPKNMPEQLTYAANKFGLQINTQNRNIMTNSLLSEKIT